MTPEGRVRGYFWWILCRIKEKLLTTLKDKPVLYNFVDVSGEGIPDAETEKRILEKLQESLVIACG
jgi:hypothetical protein